MFIYIQQLSISPSKPTYATGLWGDAETTQQNNNFLSDSAEKQKNMHTQT